MADSKLENLSFDQDKFRCPICLEDVRDPKDLPCFHTFCKSCIQTYISSTAACTGDQSVKTIECPVCRKSAQAPRNDVSSEEWACGLPQNKLIVSISVDTEQSENRNCMFCLRRSKTVEAKNWCKTCVEAICEDCKSFHLCVPSLQSHKIVSLSDVGNLNNDIEIDEPCPIHKGKFLEVFCQDHDQLCCSICFATKHRACGKVEAIEDVAAELNSLCPQMTPICFIDALKKLEDIQEEYRNKVEKLNTRKQEICACTENKVEEIISLINKAHDQWMKQFNQKHSDAVGNIEIASDEVKRYAMTVQEVKTLLEKVIDHGSPKQIFITRYKKNLRLFRFMTSQKLLLVVFTRIPAHLLHTACVTQERAWIKCMYLLGPMWSIIRSKSIEQLR
ncbi:E3 ubiquitin-protein ligase TRIM33-like isoform X2 [Crassostrea virginica]